MPRPSVYFPPCVPEWSGDNGGATGAGVSATTIVIAEISSTDDQVNNPPMSEVVQNYFKARDTFIAYWNSVLQLYGRHVDLVTFYARYPELDPDGVCQDVDRLIAQYHPFAITDAPAHFALCAADRGVVSFTFGQEFPESFYAAKHPYIWNNTMDCERTAIQLAEYLGKRVAKRPARWAGDQTLRTETRRLGLFVPDDDVFTPCVRVTEDILARDYGVHFASTFRYTIGAADSAARAVLQFKNDGVTSVVLMCDTNALETLTHVAASQDWYPEWVTTGVAQTTQDRFGRTYDQSEVNGHMFGRGGGEEAKLFGKDAEANQLYRRLRGEDLPPNIGTANFWPYLDVFDALESAGPHLTPASLAAGMLSRPTIGTGDDYLGPLSNAVRPDGSPGLSHTRVLTAREVYWDGDRTAYDGNTGTFVSTLGGKAIGQGEWPAGEPQVYPGR